MAGTHHFAPTGITSSIPRPVIESLSMGAVMIAASHVVRIAAQMSVLAILVTESWPALRIHDRVPVAEDSRRRSTPPVVRHVARRIDRPTTWRANELHELTSTVVVEAGGTLTIEAGTRIEARSGASIEISREGRLIAQGTPYQPIVFTCTSVPKYEGCWGGLTVRGNAPINFGTSSSLPVRGTGASGCRESAAGDAGFGGCDPADSSGVLRYSRVEYASRGLELLGVGRKTVIDFVQVNRSGADGVTVVGGTPDLRHLFLTANIGYGLSWRSGWRGRGQFIIVQQDERANLGGILGSNEGAAPTTFDGEPRSAPTLMNVSIISPFANGNPLSGDPSALRLRRGTAGIIRNVLVHSAATALDIDDSRTCLETSGTARLTLTNVVVANTTTLGSPDVDPLSCEPYVSPDVEAAWLNDPSNSALIITDPAVANALIRQATNLTVPDLRPAVGGATVTGPVAVPPNDGFFDVSANFIGAVPANVAVRNEIPWYSGWTVPAPVPPIPGIVAGTVASTTLGPLSGVIVRSANGRETTTSASGMYSFGLPAGEHQLTANSLPVGCGVAARSVTVISGASSTADFAVDCTSVASVSVGTFNGCVLSSAGVGQCWGGNEYGMLGDGTIVSPRTTPAFVAGSNIFDANSLSSGYTHSCVLRSGRAMCWGLNFFAALGVGSAGLFSPQPVAVGISSTPSFVRLSAGGYHSCGLTSSGAAWCWGWNQENQTGQTGATVQLLPLRVEAGALAFSQISAGESHTCALTAAGEAWCWGGNGRAELGTDPLVVGTQSAIPILVPGGHTFASIDAGTVHTCGVTTSGEAYCWGSQEFGQLGNGLVGGASSGPTLVSGGVQYLQISAGGQTTCAVTTTRAVQCWGAGASGVLGNGTTATVQSSPVTVVGGHVAGGVVVNLSEPVGATACLFTTGGAAYCWGAGASGQLGNGTLLPSSVPVQVQTRSPQ